MSTVSFFGMSTFAKIEAAFPALNVEELEQLEVKLQSFRLERALERRRVPSDLSEFAGSLCLTEDALVV